MCTPKTPSCDSCPVSTHCLAHLESSARKEQPVVEQKTPAGEVCCHCDGSRWTGRGAQSPAEFPLAKVKKAPKERVVLANVVVCPSHATCKEPSILLLRRKKSGLLAGQWEFVVDDLGAKASVTLPGYVTRSVLREPRSVPSHRCCTWWAVVGEQRGRAICTQRVFPLHTDRHSARGR